MIGRAAIVLAIALAAATPRFAAAQDPDLPPPGAVVAGPFTIIPSLRVTDLGVDNNVFNEPADPKTDFMFTLTPRAEFGLRVQRLRLSFTTVSDYVYYRKYASERGVNQSAAARAEYDLGILTPFVSATGLSTRARLNSEVDVRARHHDVTYAAGVAARVASRTRLFVNTSRLTTGFEPDETFRGVDLAQAFDSRRETIEGGLAMDLTPITRFNLAVSREQQRFTLSPDRDSNTWRVSPGLAFSPDGLVRGGANVGYRRFHTLSPALPDFSGFVASVNVGATLFGRHDLLGVVTRDVQYSYDEAADYYLGTTTGLTWTTLVGGPFDVRGTASRTLMDYRNVIETAGQDTSRTLGIGAGYRIKERARIGLNADWSRRTSPRALERNYRNHRLFVGLTWGTTL